MRTRLHSNRRPSMRRKAIPRRDSSGKAATPRRPADSPMLRTCLVYPSRHSLQLEDLLSRGSSVRRV